MRAPRLTCSFCGKGREEVRRLFDGPRAFICNECVAILADMLTDEDRAGGAPVRADHQPFIGPWAPTPHQRSKASKR